MKVLVALLQEVEGLAERVGLERCARAAAEAYLWPILFRMFWLDVALIDMQWALSGGEWGIAMEEADKWVTLNVPRWGWEQRMFWLDIALIGWQRDVPVRLDEGPW